MDRSSAQHISLLVLFFDFPCDYQTRIMIGA